VERAPRQPLGRAVQLWWKPPADFEGERAPGRTSAFDVLVWESQGSEGMLARAIRRVITPLLKKNPRARRDLETNAFLAVLGGMGGTGASPKCSSRAILPTLERQFRVWDKGLRQDFDHGRQSIANEFYGYLNWGGLVVVLGMPVPRTLAPDLFVAVLLGMLAAWGVEPGLLRPASRPLLLAHLVKITRSRAAVRSRWKKAVQKTWDEAPDHVVGAMDRFLDSIDLEPGDVLKGAVEQLIREDPQADGALRSLSSEVIGGLLVGLAFESDWEQAYDYLDANAISFDLDPARDLGEAIRHIRETTGIPFRLQTSKMTPEIRADLRRGGFLIRAEFYGALLLRDRDEPDPPSYRSEGLRQRLTRLARDIEEHGDPVAIHYGDSGTRGQPDPLEWLYDIVYFRAGLVVELEPVVGPQLWGELVEGLEQSDLDERLLEMAGLTEEAASMAPGLRLGALLTRDARKSYGRLEHPPGCPDRSGEGTHYLRCLPLSLVREVWQGALGLPQIVIDLQADALEGACSMAIPGMAGHAARAAADGE